MRFTHSAIFTVLWFFVILTSGTLLKPQIWEIKNVNATCTSQTMKIRLDLNRKFEGVVYAKGYSLEKNCRTLGTGETFVEISIDTSGCGIRLASSDDEKFTYRISLNVQVDKYLQQITDLEVSTTCSLSVNDLVYPRQYFNKQSSRTGRNKASDAQEEDQDDVINKIKTWMEIEGTSSSDNVNKVAVGEQTMVLIKTILPENLAANVVDCYAYDGTKDVAQKLLDETGCPVDESIMPSLEIINLENEDAVGSNEIAWEAGTEPEKNKKTVNSKPENVELIPESLNGEKTKVQVVGTMFSAFKFPDTANLHLKCSLQICKKKCPAVTCNSDTETASSRTGKSMKTNKNTTIIDKIEVFNSVEVVAPGIDSDGYLPNQDGIDFRSASENAFCLSASKMAFSFAVLGAVFLCGVIAALWTVMRNHFRKFNKFDGSEQVLVVRDSPLNFTTSRNKMHHNWTYS